MKHLTLFVLAIAFTVGLLLLPDAHFSDPADCSVKLEAFKTRFTAETLKGLAKAKIADQRDRFDSYTGQEDGPCTEPLFSGIFATNSSPYCEVYLQRKQPLELATEWADTVFKRLIVTKFLESEHGDGCSNDWELKRVYSWL